LRVRKNPARHFEVLAEICRRFFRDWIRPAIATLVSDSWIIADAIEANLQIRAAPVATIVSTWLAGEAPFPAALETMACHNRIYTREAAASESANGAQAMDKKPELMSRGFSK
jgi:hypothetical protein